MQLLGSPNSDRSEEVPYEAPRQQAAPPQSTPAPEKTRQQSAPAPQAAQPARPAPAARREPEPVSFESNNGDDDLPF